METRFELRKKEDGCICDKASHYAIPFGFGWPTYGLQEVDGTEWETTVFHPIYNPLVGVCLCCETSVYSLNEVVCDDCGCRLCSKCYCCGKYGDTKYCYMCRRFGYQKNEYFWKDVFNNMIRTERQKAMKENHMWFLDYLRYYPEQTLDEWCSAYDSWKDWLNGAWYY